MTVTAPAPERPAGPMPRLVQRRGGCMAAKFFAGLPLDGPDPECAQGHGAEALKAADRPPRPALDHSHRGLARGRAAVGGQPGARACRRCRPGAGVKARQADAGIATATTLVAASGMICAWTSASAL
jgi:hypothetical protein